MECLLPYFNMVTAPRETVGLERMSHYRGVGLERFTDTIYVCLLTFSLWRSNWCINHLWVLHNYCDSSH